MERTVTPAIRVRQAVRGDLGFQATCVALRDIPGTCVRVGDVLALGWPNLLPKSWVAANRRWERLPRSAFDALSASAGALTKVSDDTWKLWQYVGHHSARMGRDNTSRVIVIHPLKSGVSQAIVAASDDAALFELLASVRCQMPAGGGR